MMCCRSLLLCVIVVLFVCSTNGVLREQQEEERPGRGRLHQLCKEILNGDELSAKDGHPKHDRIRHHRQKSKCKYHMKAEERCRRKYKPRNGTVHSFHDNFYGWVVNVLCHHGYQLQGPASVICYEELKENERPFCQIKDCGMPTIRKNTTYTFSTTTYRSKLFVKCDKGFNLTGSPRSKCQASGKWSKIAKCVQKECPPIKNPAFGRYHKTVNANREQTVLFECAPGYSLVGSNLTNCYYGMWTSSEPKCVLKPDESSDSGQSTTILSTCITVIIVAAIIGIAFYVFHSHRKSRSLTELVDNKTNDHDNETCKDLEVNIDVMFTKPYMDDLSAPSTSFQSRNHTTLPYEHDELEQNTSDSQKENYENKLRTIHEDVDTSERNDSQEKASVDDFPSSSGVSYQSTSVPVLYRENHFHPIKPQLPTCLVTPLKAGDEHIEGTEPEVVPEAIGQEISNLPSEKDSSGEVLKLNWNKFFLYLVPKVCTDNWKLFAINLLGTQLPPGQSAGTTVSQIENRSRTQHGGEKIEIILFNILWYWKNLQKSADLHDIESALQWSNHHDVVYDMKNVTRTFYEAVGDAERNPTLNRNELAGIPELEYRIQPSESAITLFPCFEEQANTNESLPVPVHVPPFTEELVTCDYRFNETSGSHYQRGKHFYRTKRQFSYPPYQKLRYKYKFPERAKIPLRRLKTKPKVEVRPVPRPVPRVSSIHFTETDTMCVDLINRILDLDPSKKLNSLEFRMLTKYVLYKIHNTTFANTELHDLLGITFADFSLCDHVPTPRNGTLHIINSGEIRVILMDEEWKLMQLYVHRARNDVIDREPEADQHYLFLTYEGNQVSTEYLNMVPAESAGKIGETEEVTKATVHTGDKTIKMETDINEGPPNMTHAHKTDRTFDFKRKLPVSRQSKYDADAEKITTDNGDQLQHKRRFFCEKQTATIETVFKKEIKRGSVKEVAILTRFLNSAALRETFGITSKNVSKILIKKVADRVRCFIRKRKA